MCCLVFVVRGTALIINTIVCVLLEYMSHFFLFLFVSICIVSVTDSHVGAFGFFVLFYLFRLTRRSDQPLSTPNHRALRPM